MNGASIASEASVAIAEAGAEVGNGAPLTGVILREVGADESTYPPTEGSTTEYACTLILSEYAERDRDGTQITAKDVRAMIAANAETPPQNGDRLRIDGETFAIVQVQPYKPAGVSLYYKAQIRRA